MDKVFFLIGTLSSGGAERVVSNISLSLSNKIEKEIIMFGNNFRIDYPYDGKLLYLDNIQQSNILNKIYALMYRTNKIKKIKKRESNAVFISFLEYPNLMNALTKNYGKTIVSVRNHMSTKHKRGIKAFLWNSIIKLLYGKTDKIIVVSEEIKRDLTSNYGINESKIKVIYNSYPIQKIKQLSQDEIEDEYKNIFNYPTVITAGRLNKQKGHWHLIRSFKKVKKAIPDAKLVILGEGELFETLKKLSQELDINKDVHFLGFQKNPFKFIAKSKLFVLSSLHEGFPNAMAEAMACGIPILSTDCLSGPREILAPDEFNKKNIEYNINYERYGILVPVCDGVRYNSKDPLTKEEEIMAEYIIELLQDESLWAHFSKKSLIRIQDFDIKNMIKEWENIIRIDC